MKEEINSHVGENDEDRNTIDVPNKQSKFISTRKRKELINSDSENEEEKEKGNNIPQKIPIQNEESKESERTEYLNDNFKQKYCGNKFKTVDRNQSDNLPIKNNTALQEKLKKIFMNRDKVKFQYAKQDIPDKNQKRKVHQYQVIKKIKILNIQLKEKVLKAQINVKLVILK